MSVRVCKENQIRLIIECRQSGLSDYQWCERNGIHPGNFYNWVSKLRKSGYSFPESEAKNHAISTAQEVVKVDLIQEPEPSPVVEQNVSPSSSAVAAEVIMGNITFRFYNGADEKVIQNTLRYIGGINHAW